MTLDVAQREAKLIVGQAIARTHGFKRVDDYADACSTCEGDGEIIVGGYSVSPYSGVAVNDPQQAHPERCPACRGTGIAS